MDLARRVHDALVERIEAGAKAPVSKRFFHTEPHHDDIMLGYLPGVVRAVRAPSNTHLFVCLTSGFTAVTNPFMLEQLATLGRFIDSPAFAELMEEDYFDPEDGLGRQRDVWQYLDGVAAGRRTLRAEGVARRVVRDIMEIYGDRDFAAIHARLDKLQSEIKGQYPGEKDDARLQTLKGMVREWEAECLWGYFGWNCESVKHLRLGFYTGDIFNPKPTHDRDVAPILKALQSFHPDVVTAALDPEASGPDTHYKVLQALTEALGEHVEETGRTDIRVWGYRNVWYRFHPSEANVYIPVSLNMFSIMRSAFMNTFISQKTASFPSHEHDGPFCDLAQRIQTQQYQTIKTCLGRRWFHEHESPLIRATRGLVFLNEMSLADFNTRSRELREATQNA
ncbi:hypothetical protein HQ560_22490 [bacterium]|nr:hypothetical protein [bacterium]